ncbi:hypothetical protein NMG29_00725 [Streptomyces cocklensis]|jgi:hypothetical protein|uniref:Uncharacterized protein n=1 Tax=Actinacidiphila cocklensis TaxID=887465 RepID=A0A9W4DWM2_9ACTN|nr:hypothetical protein [Actinacidiphila cocklensis]MDD1056772.1 hypothetical protein [Actinacidiphila cocklensis]WSX77922.1 hypothetical protein OH826_31220 [Streptomyces sp. NBC_00899]CAG6397747.1 conserved hypothetical protein [Actinacidiphila cocklensis]
MPSWIIEEIVVLAVVGAVLVTVIRQVGVHLRAKAELARDTGYRAIAERSVTSQEATQAALAGIEARMATIERVLADVE